MSDRLVSMREGFKERWQPPVIEHMKISQWGWIVSHPENFTFGKYTDIGAFTFIHAKYGKIIMEDNSAIGTHSTVYTRDDTANFNGDVIIENGAYIPGHTVILPGVTIGEDAIVGAHSLVKKDVPPNEVWAGQPARFIKKVSELKVFPGLPKK